MPADALPACTWTAYDAGHGGPADPGAGSILGHTWEADLVLEVGVRARARNWDLILTRGFDQPLAYSQRRLRARRANFVIAGHMDSIPGASTHGLRAYYAKGDDIGRTMCHYAVQEAPEELRGGSAICAYDDPRVPGDGWKNRAEAVLRAYQDFDCAILIEFGYLSHPGDLAYMRSTHGLDAMAELVNRVAAHYHFLTKGV